MWRSERNDSTDDQDIRVLIWSPDAGNEILPDRAMQELEAIVAKDLGRLWILDVAAILFLSSNAIAQLIGVVRRVSLANGRMALAKPPSAVATVLKMTRLTKLLPMFDDIAAARASFRS